MRAALRNLAAVVRWGDWSATKLPLFVAAVVYALLASAPRGETPWRIAGEVPWAGVAALIVFFVLCASFGHAVNDWSDLAADRAAGKRRALAAWPPSAIHLLLIATSAGAVGAVAAAFDAPAAVLAAASIALAAAYSLRPARLKERGFLGWLAASAAQRTLPLAVAFQALQAWDVAAVLLCVLATLIGLRFIVVHQLQDLRNDRASGIDTAATRMGAQALLAFGQRWLMPAEAVLAIGTLAAMGTRVPLVWLVAVAFAAWMGIGWRRAGAPPRLSYGFLEDLYSLWLPAALAAAALAWDGRFVLLLVLVLALQYRFFRPKPARPAAQARANANAAELPTERAEADPYPRYARLREQGAVVRMHVERIGPVWLVLRHAEGLEVFKSEAFVKDPRKVAGPQAQHMRRMGADLLEMDPPEHTRLRSVLGKAFTSRLVERLEPRVEQLAAELLARAEAKGHIDLMLDYATIIPVRVIAEILGVPIDDIERFRALTWGLTVHPPGEPLPAKLEAERRSFSAHLRTIIANRRRRPREDLLSGMIHATPEGAPLTEEELVGMTYLLLLAGYVTTVSLICNGTLALLRNPGELERLRRDPSLIAAAVEELARFDGPFKMSSAYFASREVRLGGVALPRGAHVRVLIAAVNRDPAQFPDPDRLDVMRDARRHLAFGQGIHYCVGAPLARLEVRLALRQLLDRFPRLRLAVPAEKLHWFPHPVLRGVARLPLALR